MALDLDAVRSLIPVTQTTAYLNTGTAAPWSKPVVEAIEHALRRELALGRAAPAGLPDFRPLLRETRARLAHWVGADDEDLALTHSATEGIDIVAWGRDWQPADEVITTSVEHRGVLAPLRQLAHRTGVAIRTADIGPGDSAQTIAAIEALVGPRTRLIALSHVSFSTGACLPVGPIARIAHAAGAEIVVDGAQAVGAMAVDVAALDVDYYAFPGQKWLCGPEGTGGLYVRRELQDRLQATFVGTRSGGAGATRYEWGTLFRPGVHGLHAALGWLTELGQQAIFDRTRELADYCYQRCSEVPGVELLTPQNARARLVNLRLPGVDLAAAVVALGERGVTIRAVPDTASLRISCGFFNTVAELDRLVELLAMLQRGHAYCIIGK